MRITAGSMRGRKIAVPDLSGLRPTPSKVRQALFNILGNAASGMEGSTILDLYAGSGIMALESLSRGAEAATSIEQNRRAVSAMQRCCEQLSLADRWQIKQSSVESALAALTGSHFDLIFADPPYAKGFSQALPELISRHTITCGQLIIEESASVTPQWPAGWCLQQSRRYGDSCLHFLHETNRPWRGCQDCGARH